MQVQRRDPVMDGEFIRSRNRASALRLGMMLGVALLLTSTVPAELRLATLSGLLFVSAFIASAFAALSRDRLLAPHVTRWDESAVLLALSTAIGFFVDPAIVESALQQSQLPAAATGGVGG